MSKFDAEKPFTNKQNSVVNSASPLEREDIIENGNCLSVTSQLEPEKNLKNLSVPLIRVIVDEESSDQSLPHPPGNNFECQYKNQHSVNESSEENCKSIFEIKHKNRFLLFENERLTREVDSENRNQAASDNNTKYSQESFLPVLIQQNTDKENADEQAKKFSRTGRVCRKGKKTRLLYDYNDRDYLEQSRRSRRRKQSEVDIEVGIRLSRFIQTPYEGCVDKYSKKYRQKAPLQRYTQVTTLRAPKSSSEDSPLSSSSEYLDFNHFSSPLSRFNEKQTKRYFRNKRGLRRRSSSVSPPRVNTKSSLLNSFLSVQSQNTSPATSPSSSVGPSSPALSRYRTSNFETILNSADNRKKIRSRQSKSTLPDIHLSNNLNKQKSENIHLKSDSKFFNCSEKYTSNMDTSRNQENQNFSDSLRKHVLLNTTVPCGSPTFQRAMQGLQCSPKQTRKNEKTEIIRSKSPTVSRGSPTLVRKRTSSVGGRRKVLKRTTSTSNSKPALVHHVSFRDKLDNANNETDEIMTEIHDKLTSLNVTDKVTMTPRKSILKNRRRSIDDLDIGTKKGLAMYLRSKQRQTH